MARANLKIEQDILENFLSAQDMASTTRSLTVRVSEESLVLGTVIDKVGNDSEDFNNLKDILDSKTASIILFCLDNKSSELKKEWILIAWIPEMCKVREKMLYSSSREDLKRFLGIGYFTSEYGANVIPDMNWDRFFFKQP